MVWDHIIACMQMERLSFWHCTASVATTCYIIGSTCAHPLWFESGMALAALPQAEERGHGAPMTLTGDIDKSFERWLEESKVKAPKCVARSREHGRKVEARVAIRAGEVVVHVPDSAVFTAQDSRIHGRLVAAGLSDEAGPRWGAVGLAAALMLERATRSPWRPYLDFFPAKLPHLPLFWAEADLALLRGTTAWAKCEGAGGDALPPCRQAEVWETRVKPLMRAVAEDLGAGPSSVLCRRGLFLWATAVVASYSFQLGAGKVHAIVPVWDALDHVTGRANVRLRHDATAGALQMVATRDICAGEEVVNSYGELSNADLLRCYGFVEAMAGDDGGRDHAPSVVAVVPGVRVASRDVGVQLPLAEVACAAKTDAAVSEVVDALRRLDVLPGDAWVDVRHDGSLPTASCVALVAATSPKHGWRVVKAARRRTGELADAAVAMAEDRAAVEGACEAALVVAARQLAEAKGADAAIGSSSSPMARAAALVRQQEISALQSLCKTLQVDAMVGWLLEQGGPMSS